MIPFKFSNLNNTFCSFTDCIGFLGGAEGQGPILDLVENSSFTDYSVFFSI